MDWKMTCQESVDRCGDRLPVTASDRRVKARNKPLKDLNVRTVGHSTT